MRDQRVAWVGWLMGPLEWGADVVVHSAANDVQPGRPATRVADQPPSS